MCVICNIIVMVNKPALFHCCHRVNVPIRASKVCSTISSFTSSPKVTPKSKTCDTRAADPKPHTILFNSC